MGNGGVEPGEGGPVHVPVTDPAASGSGGGVGSRHGK
jgi:hypothetical protein